MSQFQSSLNNPFHINDMAADMNSLISVVLPYTAVTDGYIIVEHKPARYGWTALSVDFQNVFVDRNVGSEQSTNRFTFFIGKGQIARTIEYTSAYFVPCKGSVHV